MPPSPSERRILLFTAGGARLALRLSAVREVVPAPPGEVEVVVRGLRVAAVPLALALGLPAGPGTLGVVVETTPPAALRVDAVLGIADLAGAEVFRLPGRTVLPQPPPFLGAIVRDGEVALELDPGAAGWVALEPVPPPDERPAELDLAEGRELVFERAGVRYAVPVTLLTRVIDAPRISPVPLAPPAHRGLLFHERAIHPVFDLAALYGAGPAPGGAFVLLVDAGGTAAGFLADRVVPGGAAGREPVRPAFDAIFPA